MFFFFQAEDGIRDLVRSRGLGDVYKRQFHVHMKDVYWSKTPTKAGVFGGHIDFGHPDRFWDCLLYTSDAADDLLCVDLGGRRIINKKISQAHLSSIVITQVHYNIMPVYQSTN